MGCASSKRIEATADVYRPPPSSFAVFDVTAIDEPWLKPGPTSDSDDDEKQSPPSSPPQQHVPPPLLEKLKAMDDNTRTWDEVSKDLENLKPKLKSLPAATTDRNPKRAPTSTPPAQDSARPRLPRKSFSFHTLEELEAKTTTKPTELKRADSARTELNRFKNPPKSGTEHNTPDVPRSLKENIFIVKDRINREKEGKQTSLVKYNPLSDYPEICPPGGEDAVVLYTTSLGGVRRTYEDCNKVRQLMEIHRVVFDERDVALDGGFRSELRELVGEGVGVPRVFVKGRYVGGVDEVVGLNERGVLSRVLNWAKVERGVGRLGCEGCGGARFVPCLACGGSCKVVVVEGVKERCGECNENGLVHCPLCIS